MCTSWFAGLRPTSFTSAAVVCAAIPLLQAVDLRVGAAQAPQVRVPEAPPVVSNAPPNILLIIADDTGADTSSLYNLAGSSGVASMPAIEGLARQGLVFDRAWASPMCSPTRAAIATGLYGNRTGVTVAGQRLPTTTTTIFDYIARDSPTYYAMGVFGKWHLAGTPGTLQHVRDSGVPVFKGFLDAQVNDYFNWNAVDVNAPPSSVTAYASTAITDFAIDFIRRHRRYRQQDPPWFTWVAYNAAHSPYQVPPASLHTTNVGGRAPGTRAATLPVYQSMIQAMDREIGRLLSEVDLKDTVVIYMGDNGTPIEVKDPGSRLRGAKQSVYEGGIRVPLLAAGRGVRAGVESGLVVATDLFATLASLAGIPVSQVNDSYSLVPVLQQSGASSGRRYSFGEHCGADGRRYAIRDSRYKLLYDSSTGGWALYDLDADPLETTNRYAEAAFAAVRATLTAEMDRVKAGATAGCFQ
jgi:arylsulfatase A-like enzyme